jgi:hypothetical protein
LHQHAGPRLKIVGPGASPPCPYNNATDTAKNEAKDRLNFPPEAAEAEHDGARPSFKV